MKNATVNNVLAAVPAFQGKEMVVRPSRHTTNQIINEVLEAHRFFAPDYDRLIEKISFGSGGQVLENVFDFCRENLHYVIESSNYQSTRSPAGIIELGNDRGIGVDCKHYSGFIAGVLDAINRAKGKRVYDWCYRFASYDGSEEPEHVFVVVKKEDGKEIWVDPVLLFFNQRFPRPNYYKDKTVNMLARISGVLSQHGAAESNFPNQGMAAVGCADCKSKMGSVVLRDRRGKKIGTVSSTGAAIMKVAPALSEVPVAAIAVEAVGAALMIFGSKYGDTTEERWLIQSYEWNVKGQRVTSPNSVVQADAGPAKTWFALALGVPIPDIVPFNLLAGAHANPKPSNDQRAIAYLNNPEIKPQNIPYAQALAATYIADQLNPDANGPGGNPGQPGAWANVVSAPTLYVPTDAQLLAQAGYTNPADPASVAAITPAAPVQSGGVSGLVAWAQANPLLAGGIVLGGGFVLYKIFHKKKRK